MRRLISILLVMAVLLCCSCTVFAANSVSSASFSAYVSADGNCQITLDLQIYLDTPVDSMQFPIPGNARSITLNGNSARTSRSGNAIYVNLSSIVSNATGTFSARIQYTVPNTVAYDDQGKLQLQLPMLSGFSYTIQRLDFSITLPGIIQSKPFFRSGYLQQSIESKMDYNVAGERLSGSIFTSLKDLETLWMTLEVSDAVFPQDPIEQWSMGIEEIAMIVLASLALLYWLIFLRCAPFRHLRCAAPPQGMPAGTLSCGLTGQGGDLTMMVLSWAQMGYLLVHVQDSGRVMLHKRMDMGNERSAYEVQLFRKLFGKRSVIDGTGYHYASLSFKTASATGDIRDYFRRKSGNPKVLRVLCALAGAFGGMSLGNAIVGNALLGIILVAILTVYGAVSAWFLHSWFRGLHLRHKDSLLIALGLTVLWMLLGMMAGEAGVAACAVALQLLCGLAWAYGGRRTALGRQTAAEILGLRRYLTSLRPVDVQRIVRNDPDYFFTMAPYALALGVDRSFARLFGNRRLSSCPYLTSGMDAHMTATEWCERMRQAVHALDERSKRLYFERLLGR